jgi:uncharacterized Zn finger protein
MSWHSYSSGRELKDALQTKLEHLRKRGESFLPVQVQGRSNQIARTFWGKAWCRHLESYQDYESRLPRGRSYLRGGNVYNLAVEPGLITARVAGSSLYEVEVHIQPLSAHLWDGIRTACMGQVGSLLDLLSGKLGAGVLQHVCDPDLGLFPPQKQVRFSCSCPDWADMCKHVAATLYGVAVVFDTDPALFFRLRQVDPVELLARGAQDALQEASSVSPEIDPADLCDIFGIDLAPATDPESSAQRMSNEETIPSTCPPSSTPAPQNDAPSTRRRKANRAPQPPKKRPSESASKQRRRAAMKGKGAKP